MNLRKYQYLRNSDKFLIDGKDGTEYIGKSFFKYYALNSYNVDALTNTYVYASHPCQLNDPLDCAEEIVDFDDAESVGLLWGPSYIHLREKYGNDDNAILKLSNDAFRTIFYMKCGVLSLSDNCDDISMWSHYTGHTGFCVELDVFNFPFKTYGPFHINYEKELPIASVRELGVPVAALIQTNIKTVCWKHEDEYRLLISNPDGLDMEPFGFYADMYKEMYPDYHDRKYKYPLKCIKSVCLGINFFDKIIQYAINKEVGYVVNDMLKNKVLSFLSLSKIPTYMLAKDGLKLKKNGINIVKIKNNEYRIY